VSVPGYVARRLPVAEGELRDAFQLVFRRPATDAELLTLLAQSGVESSYGAASYQAWPEQYPTDELLTREQAYSGGKVRTNNWGAHQCRSCPGRVYVVDQHLCKAGEPCPERRFYAAPISAYPSSAQGAVGFLRFLSAKRYREALAIAASGDLRAFAAALKRAGYYEASLSDYTRALEFRAGQVRAVLDLDLSKNPSPAGAAGGGHAILLLTIAAAGAAAIFLGTRKGA
jgi:hypothetical protein